LTQALIKEIEPLLTPLVRLFDGKSIGQTLPVPAVWT
jgi:hypothetical protein